MQTPVWCLVGPGRAWDSEFLTSFHRYQCCWSLGLTLDTKADLESVQLSCSVVSESLPPHGLEHARLPCPSPTPRVCSNACPSCWQCHQTISSSVIPYSSCLQSLPASGSGWRRLLRVPWTARRSNQSILKEISTEYSLEGLKLKLQHCGHLMWRTDSLEKTLMLKKKNLESLLKGRDVTLLSKVHRVKSVVFSVVMYEY